VTGGRTKNARAPLSPLNYGNQAGAAQSTTARCRGESNDGKIFRGARRILEALRPRGDPAGLLAHRLAASYPDLEPYYDRADMISGVGQSRQSTGRKIEGGNILRSARRRELRARRCSSTTRPHFEEGARSSASPVLDARDHSSRRRTRGGRLSYCGSADAGWPIGATVVDFS